jgi:hypothetical protein
MTDFADNVKNIIKTVAPVLGTALGGPLGGLAGGLLSKALGAADGSGNIVPATQKQIEAAILGSDPATLLALKQCEADLQKHLQDLGVQEDQLAYADRDSARKREEVVQDWTPRLIAWLVVILTVAGEGLMMFYGTPKTVDPIVLGRVLGTWDSALMLVLGYYFGSSAGSAAKTEAINAQLKASA